MSSVIFLATDHAGFALKEFIKQRLKDAGHRVEDCGAHEFSDDDDYPDFIHQAAEKVATHSNARGIIFGHSGTGEAIAANRRRGVRAALFYGGDDAIVRLSREHNDTNMLSLGAGFIHEEEAWRIVLLWLETPFSHEERHARRIQKIDG